MTDTNNSTFFLLHSTFYSQYIKTLFFMVWSSILIVYSILYAIVTLYRMNNHAVRATVCTEPNWIELDCYWLNSQLHSLIDYILPDFCTSAVLYIGRWVLQLQQQQPPQAIRIDRSIFASYGHRLATHRSIHNSRNHYSINNTNNTYYKIPLPIHNHTNLLHCISPLKQPTPKT